MAEKLDDKTLLAQIAELRAKLEVSEREKTEAQETAAAISQASAFVGSADEQATGNTIEVEVCANPGQTDTKKQKWTTVKMPTYYYTIDLPAGAGTNLATNGICFYHGQTYEVDHPTLVDLKSRVARCWDHEKAIHSDNANAYRKPTAQHLMSPAAAARVRH